MDRANSQKKKQDTQIEISNNTQNTNLLEIN